ncbi:MAG: hypothetical protein BWY79_01292 [Actinobacteria bacterium ADurb.Bin444]|nr:MAG: hypothetical protein BWY79_01292 [Actinobacteria bacterium ADurb.Bin444]
MRVVAAPWVVSVTNTSPAPDAVPSVSDVETSAVLEVVVFLSQGNETEHPPTPTPMTAIRTAHSSKSATRPSERPLREAPTSFLGITGDNDGADQARGTPGAAARNSCAPGPSRLSMGATAASFFLRLRRLQQTLDPHYSPRQ